MDYDEDRGRLGFIQVVTEYIEPLLAVHGLYRTEASAYGAKFESSNVSLSVTHDRLSFEIEVAFARKGSPMGIYTLQDLLDTQLGSASSSKGVFQASSPERTRACIRDIAALLIQYGKDVLNGEASIYQRMGDVRRSHAERYTKTVVQEPVRRAAEEAWHGHDYRRACSLYASIEADLSTVERERLRYARRIKEL